MGKFWNFNYHNWMGALCSFLPPPLSFFHYFLQDNTSRWPDCPPLGGSQGDPFQDVTGCQPWKLQQCYPVGFLTTGWFLSFFMHICMHTGSLAICSQPESVGGIYLLFLQNGGEHSSHSERANIGADRDREPKRVQRWGHSSVCVHTECPEHNVDPTSALDCLTSPPCPNWSLLWVMVHSLPRLWWWLHAFSIVCKSTSVYV